MGGLSVTGKGNVDDPYVVTLSHPFSELDHATNGPLDLVGIRPGGFVEVGLTADVDDVVFPEEAGARLELLLRQDGTGNTVTWPSNVRWPGGTPPVLSTTAGQADWIDLRRLGDHWVGRLVASEIG